MNLKGFSAEVGQKWGIGSDALGNFICVNVSMALTRTDEMRNDINQLYFSDKIKYYNAAISSACINHEIMTQGSLEQEIYARRALGILISAEDDYILRNKIIKLLKKYYPAVCNSVNKFSNDELMEKYSAMNEIIRRTEKRLESGIYLYLVIYGSTEILDNSYIFSILNDVKNYCLSSPMTANIHSEIEKSNSRIQKIKALALDKLGELRNYKDILNTQKESVDDVGGIIENLFLINKIDVTQVFCGDEVIDIDKILLAYVKGRYSRQDTDFIIQVIVNGIYMQHMIDEYKKAKSIYFNNNQENIEFKLQLSEEKNKIYEEENKNIKLNMEELKEEKLLFEEKLKNNTNKLNKLHTNEIIQIKKENESLKKQLIDAEKYKVELNILREYMFEVKNEYVPSIGNTNNTIEDYIGDKKILIIGGTKSWRRKFKEKHSAILTLNGFNDNFEISILNSADYIFFYTGFMSHSTYNRAMNYIRSKEIKFGYIGKTNIDLVEEEIIDELQKLKIGRRLNLSD